MRLWILAVAALGAQFPPAVSQAAEHSVMLGDLRADYLLAPTKDSSDTADIAGVATRIDPRDLLGPSKAMRADPELPPAMPGK